MVARVQTLRGGLVVRLYRDEQLLNEVWASDGPRAAATAITIIASLLVLHSGDTLTVRRADDESPPEPPRASHFS